VPPEPWPNDDDPWQVAVAVRIALFDASRLFPSSQPSKEHAQLANYIVWSTDAEEVYGRGFAELLTDAQRQIERDLQAHPKVAQALPDETTGLRCADPVDVVGDLYEGLRRLTADAYGRPGIAGLPLDRFVVAAGDRQNHVTGRVPASRSRVMLKLDLGLDLTSFSRVAWVLAHELVCHVAAGHTGEHGQGDDISKRQFFEEGFMNRTAATLLMRWRELETMAGLVPAGHLSVTEVFAQHSRPEAMEAGRAAWQECRVAVGRDLRRRRLPLADAAEAITADATLVLNLSDDDIRRKDRFVSRARNGNVDKLSKFVQLTKGKVTPRDVFA